ncbi:MAG: DegT/DnrJ/EryC1/StrS family aminotransferase [Sumerlaeia bacterium]
MTSHGNSHSIPSGTTPKSPSTVSVPFLDLAATTAELRPDLDAAIARVLDHGKFIKGPELGQFEKAWAQYCGLSHCVGAANGTAALQALYQAVGVGPGDEVILPSHTFIATAEAVLLLGAKPVFVDVDRDTWLINPNQARLAVNDRTKAIVAVQLYGAVADMDQLRRVADSKGVALLEDAGQGHGATLHGKKCGALCDGAAFSFFPGKTLGAFGDAGGITTNLPEIDRKARLYVDHGRSGKFVHEMEGTNARLDTMQAAILLAKLPHLDKWVAHRRAIAKTYRERLCEEPFLSFGMAPQELVPDSESGYHLFVVRVPRGRESLRKALSERGISTGLHYPVPCHLQPALAHLGLQPGSLPVTERLADEVLSLPIGPAMPLDHAHVVMDALSYEINHMSQLRRRKADSGVR